jgi:hypothetical protein
VLTFPDSASARTKVRPYGIQGRQAGPARREPRPPVLKFSNREGEPPRLRCSFGGRTPALRAFEALAKEAGEPCPPVRKDLLPTAFARRLGRGKLASVLWLLTSDY